MTETTNATRLTGGAGKGRALTACLLVAAVVLLTGLLPAPPALAATTITVNSTGDVGDLDPDDGVCDANPSPSAFECTLRAAIDEANTNSGETEIGFRIPGSGVQTIRPSRPLSIREGVTVDGYTQPGASQNTQTTGTNAVLKVELDGSNLSPDSLVDGLVVDSFNEITGLAINRFPGNGVFIAGRNNTVAGNFIGTDPSGTVDRGNARDGVAVGIGFSNAPNRSDNRVGGIAPADRNVISGNGGDGVDILGVPGTASNDVLGNLIGTGKNGAANLGNGGDGVVVKRSSGGGVQQNTIAFNRGAGVLLRFDAQSQTINFAIALNSVFSNGGLGIDLESNGPGVTANDPGDKDSGPDNLQNFPVVSSAETSAAGTTVTGKLDSLPGKTYSLRFFSNPPGTDEGKKIVGQRFVSTDSSGGASFSLKASQKIAAGRTITATATDPSGNTSEFSAPKAVTSATAAAPGTAKVSGPSGTTKKRTARFAFRSAEPGATFECKLDRGEYRRCASPVKVRRLSEGRHVFLVRAVGEGGRRDQSPAKWRWRVDRNR